MRQSLTRTLLICGAALLSSAATPAGGRSFDEAPLGQARRSLHQAQAEPVDRPNADGSLVVGHGRWIGDALGIDIGRWEPLEYAPVQNGGDVPENSDEFASTLALGKGEEVGAEDPHVADAVDIVALNVQAGREYRMRIDGIDLRLISDLAVKRGLNAGSVPLDAESVRETDGEFSAGPPVYTRGWSNNHDSRTLRTNTTAWPYRTIGTLFDGSGDCTGTRIGPRHVLTAAHCIYDRDSETWNTIKFKPGRNGENSAPYGSASPIWYWVPQAYITEPGGGHAVNKWDIGIIILNKRVGNGWMGYEARPGNFLKNKTIWMRGYPRCNTAGAPAGCEPKTLWGDYKKCELNKFFSKDSDNWNREITTNCDGSDGQSGSAFYYYKNGIAVAIGEFSGQYCAGGCPNSSHNAWPNIITRITPEYLAVINWFRAAYP